MSINTEALFSDGTKEFLSPMEPRPGEGVTIRFRVAHGDKVDVFLKTHLIESPMFKDAETALFDYYRISIRLSDEPLSYIFKVRANDGSREVCFFDRYGVSNEERRQYAFKIVPGFETPEWAKGAVMYQILVDRFCNGDKSNDPLTNEYHYINTYSHHVEDWDRPPADFDVCDFYGGDLQGVEQKLYYLKSLGVEVIYFNPLFVSPSNHKYDIQDYDYIDPHYAKIMNDGGELLEDGDSDNSHATKYIKRVTDRYNLENSNAAFAYFVTEAHAKGIKVILDGVFNHCGSFNKWLDRERIYEGQSGYEPGAYISKDSPYHDYFQFFPSGKWPYNNAYDGWWGHDTLPKLNYEGSRELFDYILNIGKKWVSPPYNCDGWRLDVAADLGHSPEFNHRFWKEFRDAVKSANPDAVILAEQYDDATAWLQGDQWDTIMNYSAFMEPVSWFLTGMEKHSDKFVPEALGDGKRFELTMRHCMTQFLTPSLYCAMNELSNHDHSRFLTRTNHKVGRVSVLGSQAAEEDVNKAVLKVATVMQMTWPGAPTIYYGDEAGVCGFTDPDNRRTYPWGHCDYELIDFYRDIIFVHRSHTALKKGAFIFLDTDWNFVSYGRFTSDEKIIVAVNSSAAVFEKDVNVWKAEVPNGAQMERLFMTGERFYTMMPEYHKVENGKVHLEMKPYSAIVLRYERR